LGEEMVGVCAVMLPAAGNRGRTFDLPEIQLFAMGRDWGCAMRRWAMFLLLATTGCSTAPLAGFLDLVSPATFRPETQDPFAPTGSPPAGTFLPPQGVVPTSPPASISGPFQPTPATPSDGTFSPGPLRVPNT